MGVEGFYDSHVSRMMSCSIRAVATCTSHSLTALGILEKRISKDTFFSNLSCSLGSWMGCGHGERPKSSSTVAITVCCLCISNSIVITANLGITSRTSSTTQRSFLTNGIHKCPPPIPLHCQHQLQYTLELLPGYHQRHRELFSYTEIHKSPSPVILLLPFSPRASNPPGRWHYPMHRYHVVFV